MSACNLVRFIIILNSICIFTRIVRVKIEYQERTEFLKDFKSENVGKNKV